MTTDAPSQVETLRDELPPPGPQDPSKPRIPFKSSVVMTRQEEDAFVNFLLDRKGQIDTQMGRVEESPSGVGNAAGNTRDAGSRQGQWMGGAEGQGYRCESFLGKRSRYTDRYYSYVEDRRGWNGGDTVYAHSNLTASLAQRITRQSIAKTIAYFFGQPDDIDWFSSEAVGVEDEAESDKLKKHSRWKVDQCDVKHRFVEGVEFARVRGEAVLKATYQQRGQIYKRTATILVDEQGQPILDAHGDYIVMGDATVPQMAEPPPPGLVTRAVGALRAGVAGAKDFLLGPPAGAPQPGLGNYGAAPEDVSRGARDTAGGALALPGGDGDGADSEAMLGDVDAGPQMPPQEPQLVPTGKQVLKRDGVTVLPDSPIWNEQVITRRLVTFDGPDLAVVYFKDFGCPLDAPDVQTADVIFHTYDRSVMRVAEMFRGQYGEGDAGIADMQAATERLRDLANATSQPKAAAGQPRPEMGETNNDQAKGTPSSHFGEFCASYDLGDGNGVAELWALIDLDNKAPIYYEYLANVTVRGVRPFYVLRPRAVDSRWYGQGDMEFFDPEQEFIDLQINRYNFSNSKSGRVTFWNPSKTLEGATDGNLKLNDGHTYTLAQNAKAEEALAFVQVPFDSENLEYLLNLFMQMMQLKSGVMNGAERAAAQMPSSDTLGEEELITQSGDELFQHTIATLYPAVKETLMAVIDIIYANMNRVEVFNYFNGEGNEILSLTPEDVRDLSLNVTLSLSRTAQRKTLQTGDAAQNIVDWFYNLQPMLQDRCAHFARERLKALGVGQADKVIDPLPPEQDPNAVAQQNRVSESISYKDAPEDVRRQMESQAGMQPSTLPPVVEPAKGQPPAKAAGPAV